MLSLVLQTEFLKDPSKLLDLLNGPSGALAALVVFLVGFVFETWVMGTTYKETKKDLLSVKDENRLLRQQRDDMSAQRDQWRLVANQAVIVGKSSNRTAAAVLSRKAKDEANALAEKKI